jgi:peptide/nickel transport system permease protein
MAGRHWVGVLALSILLGIALLTAFAPYVAPHDPHAGVLRNRLLPPGSEGHLLGTDSLGRDVLSRIIYGGRVSFAVAFLTVLIAGTIGTAVGLVAGYFGGWFDRILMRFIDVQLSFPFIVLALTIAAILGASLQNIIITLIISSWVLYARLVRGEVLKLKEKVYIEASLGLGSSPLRIMWRHLLPNLVSIVIIMASLEVGRIIIAEAAISFLGFGVQPPTPAWGNMLSDGKDYIFGAWWLTAFPGAAISITTLAVNIVGDWLRDILDPHARD